MISVWTAASFGYYLIGYQLKYIRGDFFINGLVSSSSEIAAYITSGTLLRVVGIKNTLQFSYLIGFLGMFFLLVTTTDNQIWLSFFILGGKFGISQAFLVAFVAMSVLFPASISSTSFGICNVFSRIATVLAPFVAELKPESKSQIIFLIVVGISFIMGFFLTVIKEEKPTKELKQIDT